MVTKFSIPEKGDIIYFNFSPSSGHEQKGIRPAVVLSRSFINDPSGLSFVCPITSKQKFYPFEVIVRTEKISGVALSDQCRSIDYTARRVKFIEKAPDYIVEEIKQKFLTILD